MVADLKAYLDAAKTRNILVILVLWNGASLNYQNATNLVWDDSKLQTYIDKALKVFEFTFFRFIFKIKATLK
jgi:mannan endo-1,4-beta-mannosidase